MGKEKKQQPQKRLTIDLRGECDFEKSHLASKFKIVVVGYYLLLSLFVVVAVFAIVKIAIAKKTIETVKGEEIRLMSQIREIHDLREKTEFQIAQTNKLIEWQFDDIHGQKLLHLLFSGLSKEVLLEKFFLKRDQKHKHQVNLSIILKGGYRELHHEFEMMFPKLEELGLMIISQNQSEVDGGMRLHLVCQTNFLKTINDEKLF